MKQVIFRENYLLNNLSIEEVNADEINLSSFKNKNELNPLFFPNKMLNSRIRLRLLDIADDFYRTLDIEWVEVKDILFVGSLVNFNWSRYSDIDMHIVISYKDVNEDVGIVEKYLLAKKNEWNTDHENLKIYGFPIEVFVEDINGDKQSNGIYSILHNKWIKEPSKLPNINMSKYHIKDISARIMNKIDDLSDYFVNNEDLDDTYIKKVGNLWNKIKGMRKIGLSREGETAWENIVFKVLRRSGYLDKLYSLKVNVYDKDKSINKK